MYMTHALWEGVLIAIVYEEIWVCDYCGDSALG